MTDLITKVEGKYSKKDIPDIEPGDTVRVQIRILEGGDQQSARIHSFEGTVIACKGGGINRSIIVRRVTYGIGVERSFPLHSPTVADVEIVRRGQIRRAKLYYLRDRHERAARLRERREVAVEDADDANSEEKATASSSEATATEPEVGDESETEADEKVEGDTVDESSEEAPQQPIEPTAESEDDEQPAKVATQPSEVLEESSEDIDS